MTLLAVALSERSCDRLRGALLSEAALGRADLVELRLDGLDDPASADLPRLLRGPRPPVILTERHGPGGPAGRLERLRRGAELGAEWVDLDPGEVAAFGRPGGAGRIASLHDPAGRDLAQLHRTLVESGAEVAKLAVTTSDAADAAALLRVAADAAHPTIALGMGDDGLATRVLAPRVGAFATFASPSEGRETAPGQPSARRLLEDYRFRALGPRTAVYGLVGDPVAHSLSPRLHNALFRRAGLDAVYLPLRTADPRRLLAAWREDLGLAGLSITRPHKEAMAALVDALSPEARDLGAVNTVVIHLAGEDRRQVGRGPSRLGCHRQEGGGTVVVERGRATGYNTDLPAARLALEDLCRAAGLDPEGLRVLVLGAGGVARALAHAAAGLGARLTVAARDPRRARALAERFGGVGVALGDAGEARAQLVANATPVGMSPFEEAVPVPVDVVAEAVAALDAVYAPTETRFLREARSAGCRVTGGMVLFVHQARRQFELWTGLAPTDEELREALETGGG